MQELVKVWSRKFSEAWSACMLCMVQGDITVLTLNHAITASKTGALAGIAYVIALQFKLSSKWAGAYLTGILTAAADLIVHPTHFGPHGSEALVTGAVAATICIIWDRIRA